MLVEGEEFTLLIDTLSAPRDLEAVREMVPTRGRPLLVVNSHADWDHWWGNAAFPDAPIIAHRLTRERQVAEGHVVLERFRQNDAASFGDVTLRPATIAFDGTLDLDLGGMRVELSLLPGHTHDCIVAWLPERRLLFAGDVAEEPIPLLNEGVIGDWPVRLEEWADRVETVVPAHGRVSGPEILQSSARYLRSLLQGDEEVAGDDMPPFYRRAHEENVRRFKAKQPPA